MAQFDKLVDPTRQKVVTAVESFLQIDPAITITSGEMMGRGMVYSNIPLSDEELSSCQVEDDTEQLMMVRMAEGSTETWQQMEQVREQQQLV